MLSFPKVIRGVPFGSACLCGAQTAGEGQTGEEQAGVGALVRAGA